MKPILQAGKSKSRRVKHLTSKEGKEEEDRGLTMQGPGSVSQICPGVWPAAGLFGFRVQAQVIGEIIVIVPKGRSRLSQPQISSLLH